MTGEGDGLDGTSYPTFHLFFKLKYALTGEQYLALLAFETNEDRKFNANLTTSLRGNARK
jgi:hypothetical protein